VNSITELEVVLNTSAGISGSWTYRDEHNESTYNTEHYMYTYKNFM